MINRTSEGGTTVRTGRKPRLAQYAVLSAVCALVVGVYAWRAESGFLELWASEAENNYYNLLVQGFRSGQLNLKREAPTGLAQLSGSYDPAANLYDESDPYGPLDLSKYKGKFYLYFGVTPALMLFWPYVVTTGHYLLHKDAVVIFFSAGFLVSVWLLWAAWRRYFAEVGVGVMAACGLAVGWANFTLACLPCAGVYEVAISCGYALTMVTLAFLWQAMHSTEKRGWWLAGASLACGLAVGARPSLLFGAVILLIPVAMHWPERAVMGQRSQLWTLFLAATVPILLIGLGLMLYNFLRFDDPFEFGWRYQVIGTGQQIFQPQYNVRPFSPRFFWFNFQVYFLEPARWGGDFPFVHDIVARPVPQGQVGVTHAYGFLPNLPLVWLALASPLAWRGHLGALRWFGLTLVLLFGICALTLCLFFAACFRYQVDFLPVLVLLATLGILGMERALAGRPVWWRCAVRWSWSLLLVFSVLFNWLVTFGLFSEFYVACGVISLRKGQVDEAIVQLSKALDVRPDSAEACGNLGAALYRRGKVREGIVQLERAVQLKPAYAEAHNNLGTALLQQGKVTEAIGHWERALQIKPRFVEAHYNLASALILQGRVPDAIGHLEQALQFNPDFAEAHYNLASALVQQGRAAEAIGHLEQTLRLKPDFADAHCNLGFALFQQGRVVEAIGHYEQALRLKPDFAPAQNNLAWVLATCSEASVRNGARAVELAEKANRFAGGKNPDVLATLAAAYAEAGRFYDATQTAQAAIELAQAAGQAEQARQIQARLQLYQGGQPYHAEPASAP